MSYFKSNYPIIIVILVLTGFKILLWNTCMFWDSITILSRPATFLFENGLFSFHYLPQYDNGDPQLVPFYLALMWTIFGRSLFITHLSFLPILFLIYFQLYRLIKKLFPKSLFPYVYLLVAIDPSLMSQSLGLYQDSFLILFSLFIINSLIDRHKFKTMIFMLLLCMVSRRGIILTAGFMVAYFAYIKFFEKNSFQKTIKTIIMYYLPAILFVLIFVLWRMKIYGWFFTTNQTNTGELVEMNGFIKNTLILIRWFFENGRIFLWLPFIYLLFKAKNHYKFFSGNILLILIFVFLLLAMLTVTLSIKNPFGARYFIVHFILFSILFSKLLISFTTENVVKKVILILSLLVFSSNFWIYPEKIAQSWDSSLAHLDYFKLRKEAIKYFESNKINFNNVGVGFPMTAEFKYVDLNFDSRRFSNFDFKRNQLIVYSNINNCTDIEIETLKKWILVKEFTRGRVFMRIYLNPIFKIKGKQY